MQAPGAGWIAAALTWAILGLGCVSPKKVTPAELKTRATHGAVLRAHLTEGNLVRGSFRDGNEFECTLSSLSEWAPLARVMQESGTDLLFTGERDRPAGRALWGCARSTW
jgi:hypothetical protein